MGVRRTHTPDSCARLAVFASARLYAATPAAKDYGSCGRAARRWCSVAYKANVCSCFNCAETIDKEQNSRAMVHQLAQRCDEIEQEKESHIVQLDETIAQLKDQLQQTKARVGDEGKYIKKEANVNVAVAFKKSQQEVDGYTSRIKELQRLAAEEATCHQEVCEFLQKNYVELSRKLGEWTDKVEADTTNKDHELEQLQSDRARDLDLLTKLTDKYNAYEKVCVEDRKRREKQKKQAEKAVRNLAAAVKVQSWWRAQLVRHKLGPFASKKKKGKGKKGKKKK